MGNLFNVVLFEPFLNAIVFIYKYIGDLGVAIIILTVIIRLILYLPSRSSIRSQKALQDIQPKIKELQKKFKDNKEELGRQLMKFYKENKINPLSSCLPLLIQLPILIGLYRAFMAVSQVDPQTSILVSDQIAHLYGPLRDIYTTTPIHTTFLGLFSLSTNHNIILAVLAAGFQFWQSKMMMSRKPVVKTEGSKDESITATMNKQMTYFFPLITGWFAYSFPAGLALYWVLTTVLTILQQYYIFKKSNKPKEEVKNVITQ